MEARTLVADADQPHAATVLVRRLLADADHHRVAVTARPRNPRVADTYRVLRFVTLPASSGRILLRPPQPVEGPGGGQS